MGELGNESGWEMRAVVIGRNLAHSGDLKHFAVFVNHRESSPNAQEPFVLCVESRETVIGSALIKNRFPVSS